MPSNKLEQAAIAARSRQIPTNTYNGEAQGQEYSAGHTRAKSDDKTPEHGKGTNTYLDTANGGSSSDINGAANAAGSGRIQNVAFNEFNRDKVYVHPDTSANAGQFTFH